MRRSVVRGRGWHRDLPDFRDYCPDSPAVQEKLGRLKRSSSSHSGTPPRVDLREYFPEVCDQQQANSSTAHACIGLAEYFERRAHGKLVELSRLFLYKVTRQLLGVTGDTGADLRTGFRAMVCFGVPEERYWPYDLEKLDDEPGAFLYSFPNAYQSACYVRLDARNAPGSRTLAVAKSFLAAGFPCAFGFPVPASVSGDGGIPYRPIFDHLCGGQAVVAAGYDDRRLRETRGAILIRNSWGKNWGEDGYGWLPYVYVEQQLAVDFWTLLRQDWLDSEEFTQPRP